MTVLSSGIDDIIPQSGVTVAAADASFTPAAGTYTSQTPTYNLLNYGYKIGWSIKFKIKLCKDSNPHSNKTL